MAKPPSKTSKHVGGQAVIEGVMMRAPGGIAICVRCENGSIATRSFPYISRTERRKALGIPIVRGAVTLVEMLILGIQALNWSAQQAAETEVQSTEDKVQSTKDKGQGAKGKKGAEAAVAFTLVIALALGVGFFFYLPLLLSGVVVGQENQVLFNLVAGLIRVAFFLGYVSLIQFIPDIRRIFQYHGAEHKAIFCYESGSELSIDKAATYSARHPRCGTSFLLIVFVFAIIVFGAADSLLFGLWGVTPSRLLRLLYHLALLPVVAGVSYELMKFSSRRIENRVIRLLLSPGLALQKITTREPESSQLEVGIASLKEALRFKAKEKDGT
ncbi:DUF1385 domain-containing protein [candidate division TA06 bacterium]|uniref:DUF1385 domain-containing protein n=1 Tax=candidate division TA06 bacterium TaxID=2250710 RepID=A0A523UP67_UNCT6|nr:MAG: DUF1385 domain-containing protein [candidate division TA06 bacterium]